MSCSIDLSDIDTQKTLEKVIESKKSINGSISDLVNIINKFDCKDKLSKIEKDLCDYIDNHKDLKQILKEINKPKVFMEDGKFIEFKYYNYTMTIAAPLNKKYEDTTNEHSNNILKITDDSCIRSSYTEKKVMKKLLYDNMITYFPNIKIKYNKMYRCICNTYKKCDIDEDCYPKFIYEFIIKDKETLSKLESIRKNISKCIISDCKLDKKHEFSNYCYKHSKPKAIYYDSESDEDFIY